MQLTIYPLKRKSNMNEIIETLKIGIVALMVTLTLGFASICLTLQSIKFVLENKKEGN